MHLRSLGMLVTALAACDHGSQPPDGARQAAAAANPVYHFEISVTDMDRAVRFYQSVFGYELSRQTVDGYEIAFFPRADGEPGSSGALAKGNVYVPSTSGAIIYFDVADIDPVLERAVAQSRKCSFSEETHRGGRLRRRNFR